MSSLRLKEQDDLISLIRRLLSNSSSSSVHEVFLKIQDLLQEHFLDPASSRLKSLCPSIRGVFLKLDILSALDEYEKRTGVYLSRRTYVSPTFSEVRSILNLSVVHAVAPNLKLLTLDADDTLYNDGGSLSFDAPNIPYLIRLLKCGVKVAVVTAAAYPKEPHRYENRLSGLLSAMAFAVEAGAPPGPLVDNFFVMGGQCNYALRARCTLSPTVRVFLEEIPGGQWKKFRGVRWEEKDVAATLDVAEEALRSTCARLLLTPSTLLIRKERAVGVIPKDAVGSPLSYELLEELTLATQAALEKFAGVPTCAFNGGHDVFVDVGSKSLGITALQGLLGVSSPHTLHVGDRFTSTGNDLGSRDCANSLWVAGPHDTLFLLSVLTPLVIEKRGRGGVMVSHEAAAAAAEGAAPLLESFPPKPQQNESSRSMESSEGISSPRVLHLAKATTTTTTTTAAAAAAAASVCFEEKQSLPDIGSDGVILPPHSHPLTIPNSGSCPSLLSLAAFFAEAAGASSREEGEREVRVDSTPSSPRKNYNNMKPSHHSEDLGGVGVEAGFGGDRDTGAAFAAAERSLWRAAGGHVVSGQQQQQQQQQQ